MTCAVLNLKPEMPEWPSESRIRHLALAALCGLAVMAATIGLISPMRMAGAQFEDDSSQAASMTLPSDVYGIAASAGAAAAIVAIH